MSSTFGNNYQLKMARNHMELFYQMAGESFQEIYNVVADRTMLSIERLYDLFLSCRYIEQAAIPGALVEVGVWRGGALAAGMLSMPQASRGIVGFDTFEGHMIPAVEEVDIRGRSMRDAWLRETNDTGAWAKADFEECLTYLQGVAGKFMDLQLVKGDVKEELSKWTEQPIAILRIDCDWYAESLLSLERLWPHLVPGGVL